MVNYAGISFGSLMPGRTLIDTARKCIDITRTDLVWKKWEYTLEEAIYDGFLFMNLSVIGDDAELYEEERETRIVLKERDELRLVLHDTVRGGELSLMGEVNSIGDEGVVVRVQAKDSTGATQLIQQAHLLRIAERIDLPLKEGYSDYVVTLSGVIDLTLFDYRYIGGSFVERQTILTVCDDSGDRYRYGFNGQEKDNELKGLGNSLDFGARMFDNRVGRWFVVDPLAWKYPAISSYVFVANSPMMFIDPDGREIRIEGKDANDPFVQETLKNLQMLTNDELDIKDGIVYIKNKNSVNLDKKLIHGTKLVSELVGNEFENTIKESNNFANSALYTKGDVFEKQAGEVFFNSKSTNIGNAIDASGSSKRPAFIGLAHELIHIRHMNKGLIYKFRYKKSRKNTVRLSESVLYGSEDLDANEVMTRFIEGFIRDEHKMADRLNVEDRVHMRNVIKTNKEEERKNNK